MSLRDKLSRLDSSAPREQDDRPVGEEWITQIEHELQIRTIRDKRSFFLLKENSYPIFNDPSFLALQEEGFQVNHLNRLSPEMPPGGCNLRDAIFIDTETTGLSGGVGTYAFLVGIGHIELDHVVVRQYLLPDFPSEWLMLEHLESIFQGYKYTVSFNGKAFDLPLLKTRYVLNRQETILEDMLHVDVLHAARRLWKQRLPACDLQSLERHILDIHRIEDVPGDLIPQLYFEFMRKRQAFLLRNVLEHNFHDIVNMVLLTARMGRICEAPSQELAEADDLYSYSRYLFKGGYFPETIELANYLTETFGQESRWFSRARYLAAMAMKKLGDRPSSKRELQELFDQNVFHPTVVEELAKVLEHEDKDFELAIAVVDSGLMYLTNLRQLSPRSPLLKYVKTMKHRRNRLVRKYGAANAAKDSSV
ncbi:MAG: ribonuclease H-like domain-containing protein [Calditrichia bacterium]